MTNLLPIKDPAVYRELVNTLYRQSPPIFLGNIAVAGLSVFLLWDEVARGNLLGWAAAVYLLTVLRVALVWKDRRRGPHRLEDTSRRCRQYVFWVAVSGCLWGAMGPLFFAPENTIVTVYLGIVLAGMTGGSVASLSAFWPAYYLYALLTVLPFALRAFAHGTPLFSVLGVLSLFLLGVNLAYCRVMQRTLSDAIRLRFENAALVRQLTQEKDRAEQANHSKSQFLAAASHDLRQPAHALGLYIESMRMAAQAPKIERAAIETLAERLQSALTSMSQLLDVLLDVSRLDAGVIQVERRRFRLQDTFDTLANQYTQAAAAKGLELKIRRTDVRPDTDPILLQNMLSNLLSNAVRYTAHGKILLACRRRHDALDICVLDTGIGIAEDQFDRIFQEFYQVENIVRDREHGLGLGLAIVKRTAALIGAELRLRSVHGKGSCFTVSLPHRDEPARAPLPSAQMTLRPQAAGQHTVLVVDDDKQVLDGMAVLLASWGYAAIAARSLEHALRALDDATPQLIVTDFRLAAEATGIDVVHAVRQAVGWDVPALIITGDTSPQGISAANASGLKVLHKPLDIATLKEAMAIEVLHLPSRISPR
ncbi:hybrid sensor histidine kinase/response regulator [Achromobacter sp. UMC71]|uniref:ATP-binding response regulator n=1 Tax=Achromobacter sp. UMC71 TaxID=1862320 RepID=UPI0016015D95|nr:hybrid sensor histidine kinase/response regulator [Achromobacter sp. UMC71]MBB1627306.1 hybrid sensor histidine kinase/response regulator [Achromobacter sp. UMC71]